MMRKPFVWVTALLLFSVSAYSQQQSGKPKIKVEMSKEVNGQKQTFKGEYNSEEEMLADPSYQEFAGKDGGVHMWMGEGGKNGFFFNMDSFDDLKKQFFRFKSDENDPFSFDFFNSDSSQFSFNNKDFENLSEKMKALGIEMQSMAKQFNSQYNNTRKTNAVMKITEATEAEFGRIARVGKSEKLVLNSLQIDTHPMANRSFRLRFKLPEEGELEVRVLNKAQKAIFSRYFERYGGFYSQNIDLKGVPAGSYLLEVKLNNKRLLRKIAIK